MFTCIWSKGEKYRLNIEIDFLGEKWSTTTSGGARELCGIPAFEGHREEQQPVQREEA